MKITSQNDTRVLRDFDTSTTVKQDVERLFFGVHSKVQSNIILQNNLDEFEWVVRNKVYPNFYGRYIVGDKCLTRDEINFLHRKGCKIAAIYQSADVKDIEEQGMLIANNAIHRSYELSIPVGTAIFLELSEDEEASRDYMLGFARTLLNYGYTPGFKANTDAKFSFDREFSRGMQTNRDVFKNCLVWAVAPTIKEYDNITTSHLIHPSNWTPYAPSGITRSKIALWQYGQNCHPIEDNTGKMTTFNLDLVRNEEVIIKKMF